MLMLKKGFERMKGLAMTHMMNLTILIMKLMNRMKICLNMRQLMLRMKIFIHQLREVKVKRILIKNLIGLGLVHSQIGCHLI
jgi:hypothetical protein